jgi:hypothetical protein
MTVKQADQQVEEAVNRLTAAIRAEDKARARWRSKRAGTSEARRARATLRAKKRAVGKAENALSLAKIKRQRAQAAANKTLGERAYEEALKLVGVEEHGGNNRGEMVEKIIRYAQGQVPEAWCVDFNIWCYGHAGSEVVAPGYTRAVRFMVPWSGLIVVGSPKRGDMVRFTFDHTGLFVKDNGDGTITTIEGNTGATGAVSDSANGGDGVYVKVRSKSLVRDYIRVTR